MVSAACAAACGRTPNAAFAMRSGAAAAQRAAHPAAAAPRASWGYVEPPGFRAMRMKHELLTVTTSGRGLVELTASVQRCVSASGLRNGLSTIFIRHTSASLLIQENADPEVQRDLERFLARLVPDGDPLFEHAAEGRDDMPAHVRSALTQTHLSIPLIDGALALGTWQGIYLYEHRLRGHRREVLVHLLGDA
jgi:secondary thiamine-phosphate synthase enzyme